MRKFKDADIARLYHLHSSNLRARSIDLGVESDLPPIRFRTYPGAKRFDLPGRNFDVRMALGDALRERSSRRDFVAETLPLEKLGKLLHTSYGVRGRKQVEGDWSYDRPVPSAGGLFPLETYVVTQNVSGLADGIYHYDARAHQFEERGLGRFQEALATLTIGQDMILSANVVIVITAIRDRTMWKYGQRGYRFLWLDAGHLGQNFYLVGTALGLGVSAIGGFFDQELNALMELPGNEEAIYLLCAGNVEQPAGGSGPIK